MPRKASLPIRVATHLLPSLPRRPGLRVVAAGITPTCSVSAFLVAKPERLRRSGWRKLAASAAGAAWCAGVCAQQVPAPNLLDQDVNQCVAAASERHGVHQDLLTAILRVESGMRADPVRRNANGSIDVGIAQINSVHFAELKRHGIEWPHLLQPCVGIHVAAWHLKKQIVRLGNTWFAVGAYHSLTPRFNQLYQERVVLELKRMGKLPR
jgi:soluble lytic murein transglycosylase-like protein